MQRFKNILVVIDPKNESRAVAERAVDLARRNGARVTLVCTIGELPLAGQKQIAAETPAESRRLSLDIIEEWPPARSTPYTAAARGPSRASGRANS